MYELDHLKAFIVLAQELHFRRAAERLNITQPPLSKKLKHLEDALRVTLVRRTTRTVELTEAGKILLEGAQKIFQQLETVNHEVQMAAAGSAGRLNIGFVPSASYVFLPYLLQAMKKRYPKVDIHLQELAYVQILGKLKSHEIDLALLRTSAREDSIQSHVAMIEALIVAVPRSHRLARLQTIPIEDLHDEKFVAFSVQDSPYFSVRIQDLLSQKKVQPRIVQYSLLPTILSFVEAGIGVALVPESVSRIRNPNVVYRRLSGPGKEVELRAAWLKHQNSTLLNNALSIIQEAPMRPLNR